MRQRRWVRLVALGAAVVGGMDRPAEAGMPSFGLSEVAELRLEAISFFLALGLLAAWGIRRIWNGLRRDFPWVPVLSFGRSVGLVTLWGCLFVLILTMISGARELMTPGAWRKEGLTYKLAEGAPEPTNPADTLPTRRVALERLGALLRAYADRHDGRYPPSVAESGLPDALWLVPDPSSLRYAYRPGLTVATGAAPVTLEPDIFGPERLVFRADGAILPMTNAAIDRAIHPDGGPR